MQSGSAQVPTDESKTWDMIMKDESALPVNCTSYQEYGCHTKSVSYSCIATWRN